MNQSNFLQIGLQAAKEGGEIAMKYFTSPNLQIKYKEDRSPLTIADEKVEDKIKSLINNAFPNHSIIAEESENLTEFGEYVWIIDPIDGTLKFSRGIPLFSIQIALVHNGEVVLGVTNNPALNEIYHAEKFGGAYKNNKRIRVSNVSKLEESIISEGSSKHFFRRNKLKELTNLTNASRSRGFGDAYAYSLLANGNIDIVIEAKTQLWDIAASKIIIEEAGGKVTDFDGKPISLDNWRQDLEILASNQLLHDIALKKIN